MNKKNDHHQTNGKISVLADCWTAELTEMSELPTQELTEMSEPNSQNWPRCPKSPLLIGRDVRGCAGRDVRACAGVLAKMSELPRALREQI
ncbi:hypothetical protein [Deinococcus ficus]|uniref:hypothetical protein n=1 Tax=Deinococcus ficus TaxID=317577 RepID=UPI00138B026F|nr:hypothetical protein [Deinococcus ficus]